MTSPNTGRHARGEITAFPLTSRLFSSLLTRSVCPHPVFPYSPTSYLLRELYKTNSYMLTLMCMKAQRQNACTYTQRPHTSGEFRFQRNLRKHRQHLIIINAAIIAARREELRSGSAICLSTCFSTTPFIFPPQSIFLQRFIGSE